MSKSTCITAINEFHNTRAKLHVRELIKDGGYYYFRLTPWQERKVRSLCGLTGCKCPEPKYYTEDGRRVFPDWP